jgi:glutathione S-transferase
MKIYGDHISGNCLKVKYVCDLLSIPYDWVETSVLKGEARSPEISALNPAKQLPFIVLEDGRVLSQSNAIMRFLSIGSGLIPSDPFEAAQMDQWLFWEQYSFEANIAVIRFHHALLETPLEECDQTKIEKGYSALDLMEKHLSAHRWFAGAKLTLADIALYAYAQFAEEGGFKLLAYPNIRCWLDRVARDLCQD